MINFEEIARQIMALNNPTNREIEIFIKLAYLQGREDEQEKNKNT